MCVRRPFAVGIAVLAALSGAGFSEVCVSAQELPEGAQPPTMSLAVQEKSTVDRNWNRIWDVLEEGSGPQDVIVVWARMPDHFTGDVHAVFPGFRAYRATVTQEELQQLASAEWVDSVQPAGSARMNADVQVPAVKARPSDEYSPHTAWELGYYGRGVNIAIMDTGADDDHPSLKGKFIAGADFTKPETPLTPRDGSFNPDDMNGHGTTTSAIAMGTGAPEGKYTGTATAAMLVDVRIGTIIGYAPGEIIVIDPGIADASLQATAWVIAHKDTKWQGAPAENRGIDVLSLSWSIDVRTSSDGTDIYSQALNDAVDAGIVVVVAAGNSGPDNDGFDGMSAADRVITVAAADDRNTISRDDDIIAWYSSRGPRADDGDGYPVDELKPDVAAPGTNITQAQFSRNPFGSAQGYGSRGSGTSYATPCVAGIVAMMLEANPELTPEVVKEILRFTAERRGNATLPDIDPFWNRDFGWGIVDAYNATLLASRIENVSAIDVELQNFVTNVSTDGEHLIVRGIAWSRVGDDFGVRVQVDGKWYEADVEDGNWSVSIPAKFGEGSLVAVAYNGSRTSLPHHVSYSVEVVLYQGSQPVCWCIPAVAVVVPVVYLVYKKVRPVRMAYIKIKRVRNMVLRALRGRP